MKGKIIGISGPTVTVELAGLRLYDRVAVGEATLMGEVVRLRRNTAIVQVYEETKGLGVGEPATGLGMPLTVRLGPGLLGSIFDGLQRPLARLVESFGPFIHAGSELPPLESGKLWHFLPLKNNGDHLKKGELLGTIPEGALQHPVFSLEAEGRIEYLAEGEFQLEQPVAVLAGGKKIFAWHTWPVRSPKPFARKLPPVEPLVTGQRCIDFFFSLARGGTAIFPGGFGTGKTILEQSITKFADAEVVIYVGCGERGNEMAEMLDEFASLTDPWNGKPLSDRTIMVVNTSNMPVAAREASIYTAATMAEYYRDMGLNVLFLADSISRWAEALREISSALEEMPGEEGYPTHLSSRLASFFSRAGSVETVNGREGSLTMILSVSPPGGDFTEPVTQACLRTTGAFLMLDTNLAHRRHFPAINWLQSYSLYEKDLDRHFEEHVSEEWSNNKAVCRDILLREEKLREVAEIVGAEGLQDEDNLLMQAAARIRREFLAQNAYTEDAFSAPEQTCEKISAILHWYRQAAKRLAAGELLTDILRSSEPDQEQQILQPENEKEENPTNATQ
ncbi:MAG: V-type ATP synthase subunit A [Deltaproteobacteria bacterium]